MAHGDDLRRAKGIKAEAGNAEPPIREGHRYCSKKKKKSDRAGAWILGEGESSSQK